MTSKMVDSRYHNIDVFQILRIAVQNSPESKDDDTKTLLTSILAELSLPDCKSKKFGNTFVVMHVKDRMCSFRAFNADIAPNFVNNSKKFVLWAYNEEGVDYGVTVFNDIAIAKLLKTISQNPPQSGMGYQLEQSGDLYRCTLKFGKERA
jgi:hypothetical protein